MKITTLRAPEETSEYYKLSDKITVFLAGSIDMGKYNWQENVEEELEKRFNKDDLTTYLEIVLLSPLRKDWDSSWKQEKENKEFNEQVTWELDNIEKCDIMFINFEPDSQSPITLLELGLSINDRESKDLIVRCPKKFYRHGNVDIVLDRNKNEPIEEYDKALDALYERIKSIILKNKERFLK